MDQIEEIKKLTQELLQYCHEYYDLDAPSISDAEYDRKYDALKRMEDEANFWLANSPTRKVQGEVLPYLTKVRHSVPMLSADKSTDIADVVKFIGNKDVIVTYKFDGGTCVVKYRDGKLIQGLSRGSGYDGEDITHTVRMIKNLPLTIPYKGYLEIRGEALIPWKEYNEMNVDGTLGHPRNVCTGALRQLNANEAAKRNIHFYAFTLVNWREIGVKTKSQSLAFMQDCGFDISPSCICTPYGATTELQVQFAVKDLNRENYELPTDGWVFEYNDLEYGESLGSTEHHDRKLYALKPARTDYTTRFRGVEYNTCRTGVVSLTALFDPVEIDNTIVAKATLHNVDYFNSLELGEGDEIVTAKMNEIIPAVLDNKTRSNTYKLIDKCPSCGADLIIKNTGTANVLYCPNEECPSRNLAKFTHFVSKNCMDIRNLSEATLEFLISKGWLHTFRDIYHLADYKSEWERCEGFGKASVKKILDAIEMSRNVKLESFIAALGIDCIGTSASKTIANAFNGSFDAFFYALKTNYDWSLLPDFGAITARNIADYGSKFSDEVYFLAQEMQFLERESKVVAENPMKGKKFCITGSFSQSRDVLKQKLESLGAIFVSGVSKNLDVLFCGDKAGSKLTKAQSLGVRVAYEDELMNLLGEL